MTQSIDSPTGQSAEVSQRSKRKRGLPSAHDSRARALPPAMVAKQFRPGESGNPSGRGHFHAQALRMARDMTPAAIRRLGELGGLLPGPDGEWIPLERLDVDPRVVEIACITLIERTMGKPQPFDPNTEAGTTSEDLNRALSRLSPERRAQLRAAVEMQRQILAAALTEAGGDSPSGNGDGR